MFGLPLETTWATAAMRASYFFIFLANEKNASYCNNRMFLDQHLMAILVRHIFHGFQQQRNHLMKIGEYKVGHR